jgi:glycosyltransferase involved in cell wall biosynthesis
MKSHTPISIVHIASGDLWAGAEVQLFTLAKTLHSFENVAVRVILLNHGELENRLQEVGIEVAVLNETQLNGFHIFWRLRKLLKSWSPDVVHTHRIKENILGGLAAKFSGNIPSIRTVHGAPENKPSWLKLHKRIYFILDRLVGRYVQRKIIAVSDDLAEKLQKIFPAEKIHVIENGIDMDSIKKQADSQGSLNRPKDHTYKIGLVGRLVPVKRVDLFIKTARYFRDHYQEANGHFYIYGDGPLRNELIELSNELDVSNIVHFKGHYPNIHQEMVNLDLLVMPSDHEGLPMTLLEAMALGVPVIAHAVGGIPKLLCGGICGTLIQENNPEPYAEAINSLLISPENIQNFITVARENVTHNYTSINNAYDYLNNYLN